MMAVAIAGLALAAYGTVSSISAEQTAANEQTQAYNAQVQSNNDANILTQDQLAATNRANIGATVAALGAAGVDPNTGSSVTDRETDAQSYGQQKYITDFSTQVKNYGLWENTNAQLTQDQQMQDQSIASFGSKALSAGTSSGMLNTVFGGTGSTSAAGSDAPLINNTSVSSSGPLGPGAFS